MRSVPCVLLLAASVVAANVKTVVAGDAEKGFRSIFDGKTLKGWDGNPKFWSVKDGTITGQTTKENPTKGNTFIVWTGGKTGDFELKLQYRIVANNKRGFANSGIQYRSFRLKNAADKWRIGGYQADFENGKTFSGILYGERFRGILCLRGQKSELVRDGNKFVVKTVGKVGDSAEIQKKIKKADWNDYHVIARRFHFVHKINGVTTADCTDNDKTMRRKSGLLALQLHAGQPMTVQFRRIRIKRLGKKGDKTSLRLRAPGARVAVDEGRVRVRTPFVGVGVNKRRVRVRVLGLEINIGRKRSRVARPDQREGRGDRRDVPNVSPPPPAPPAPLTAIRAPRTGAAVAVGKTKTKTIVLIAGRKSHGYGAHEHRAGCMLLAKALNESGLPVKAVVVTGGWPQDDSILDDADSIVIYADGGGRHPFNRHLDRLDKLMKKGVGLVCIHYGVEVPKGKSGDAFLDWTGGYFEAHWSVNPHWTANYKKLPKHAISRGVKPFRINDEWYYHMRFRAKGVTPILTDLPPKSTLRRKDGPHSGNKFVRAEIAKGIAQHMAWATERKDGGRGFGFTGGHFHWNWGHNQFRKLMLNAIVWTAKVEVPKTGVPSKPLTVKELMANQDYKPRDRFNPLRIQRLLDDWNRATETK
ncbi:MAG: family 16 glycoside hydrolase [Planctomycetaceae bacterium]